MGKQLIPGSGNAIDLLTIHPPSLSESSQYYAVYYENQKIGFAEAARLPGENGKTRFLDRAYWQFKVQGQPQKMVIETAATVSQNWDLEHFKMRIDGGYTSISVEGTISDSILDLSGGMRQRVSLAISLVHRPALLIADEPTGNLDTDNGRRVLDILRTLNDDIGVAVLLATHDQTIAAGADRILRMRDGLVVDSSDSAA